MIRFEDVDIAYGATTAVRGLNLTVEQGEFLTLLGPSGCGKTSILRCLAGFVPVRRGRVLTFGEDITGVPAERRGIGIVFQNYALFPHLSVRENVAFGLKVAGGMTPQAVTRAVDAMLERTGIASQAAKRPSDLSGGQQQRVAIARSLVTNPRILLMDEPLSNLDVGLRVAMREEIRRLQRQFGVTTLFVTHDQEEALALSDRVAVINQGRLLQIGTPADVYLRPTSASVCRFMGAVNELPPEVAGPGCLVRHERVRPVADAADFAWDAAVEDVIFLGATMKLRLATPIGPLHMMCASQMLLRAGARLRVGFDRADVHRSRLGRARWARGCCGERGSWFSRG